VKATRKKTTEICEMKSPKIPAVAVASLAALALLVPGSAFAAKGGNGSGKGSHPKNAKVIVGTVETGGYTAGQSVVVNTGTTASPNDVIVTLPKHLKLVDETANGTAAPADGDSVAAFVRWHKGAAIAKKLEYSESSSPFAYDHKEFSGKFGSATSPDPSGNGTLTLLGLGKKNSAQPPEFNTDSATKFRQNGKAVVDASGYTAGERMSVRGLAMTDGFWNAAQVDGHATHKGGKGPK
jgi:hypothetical protein